MTLPLLSMGSCFCPSSKGKNAQIKLESFDLNGDFYT